MPVAVVTAGDSGIGKATAVTLAQRGFDVGFTWHSDDAGAQDTAAEIRGQGRRAELRRVDLGAASVGPAGGHFVPCFAPDPAHTSKCSLSGRKSDFGRAGCAGGRFCPLDDAQARPHPADPYRL